MLEQQLSDSLERRAGGFLSAAQFTSAADARRASEIIRGAGSVARDRGLAGLEGYLAALDTLDTLASPGARQARTAIRAAIDEAFATVSIDLWTGRSPGLS